MIDSLTLAVLTFIGQLISTVIVGVTAYFIYRQVGLMRRDTQAQAYGVAREILQDEKVRVARERVFQLRSVSIDEWSVLDKDQAGIVCHTYDSVGQMVRQKLLWKKPIIDSWGPSILGIWPIVSPLVKEYRKDWDADEYWDDFEWLYREVLRADLC